MPCLWKEHHCYGATEWQGLKSGNTQHYSQGREGTPSDLCLSSLGAARSEGHFCPLKHVRKPLGTLKTDFTPPYAIFSVLGGEIGGQ